MTPRNLEDLYVHQLRDIYSAETQIADALRTMADKANDERLIRAFRDHLAETERQKGRIEQIFESYNMSPSGVTCHATKGLVKEAQEHISEASSFLGSDAPSEVLDASLIADAQRVEHYEIAAYGTVRAYAEALGRTDEHRLLSESLEEEKAADARLNKLATDLVNPAAARA